MANTPTLIRAYRGQPGISDTLLYTCPANTRVRILAATACNEGTTTRWFSMHMVTTGGAAADSNLALNQKALTSRASYVVNEIIGHILEPGDFLSSIAEAAAEITLHISAVAIA